MASTCCFTLYRRPVKCAFLSPLWNENHSTLRKLQSTRITYSLFRYICMQSKDEQTGENVASHEENATDLKIDSTCRDGVASHGSVVARVNHGKTMSAVASSLRVDRVAATALGMGRKKLQYAMLGGKLFLNKERVDKGSVLVWNNDKIDVVSEDQKQDDKVVFSRVEVDNVGELTNKGKTNLTLTRYKNLVKAKSDFEQEYRM